jgi:hypothetical protein
MANDFTGESVQTTQKSRRIKKSDFKHHLFIESYGIRVRITSNKPEAIKAARKKIKENLPDCFTEIEETETEHNFLLAWNRSEDDSLYKNGKMIFARTRRKNLLEYFGSDIRRTIAEFAVGRVFIHSGAVSWKGRAIIIPAKSFRGKTALTAALVKRGALYYSDEYAVLDDEGFLHPFPKTLSIRGEIDEYQQVEYPVEKLGGTAATEKTRVGMILISEYKPFAKWNPQILSPAKGIMEIIRHTVPIRTNPAYVLKVLDKIVNNAIIVKSRRADVSKSADSILDFFEKNCI